MELVSNPINYNQNIPPGCIVCAWCAKVGIKLFTLRTATGCKAFCSELCFTQCRRASFKKNKICDWCKHVRHTVNYVDFQDGEQQLQFCSNKCLNQYKMNIFCNEFNETKAHLHLNNSIVKDTTKPTPVSNVSNLITPELWLKNTDNENNSVNSFKDSSDSESELELEDSQPLPGLSLKRKISDISKDNNDIKTNAKQKDNSIKEKSTKDSKRVKHSNKLSNSSRHTSQTSGAKHSNPKHSNPEFIQTIERSSRETKDKSSNFHSSSYRAHRHSPIPPSVPSHRTSMVAPNHNIPLLNGTSAVSSNIRSSAPSNPIAPNGSPSVSLFPRLPGSIGRAEHPIRAPIMPSPTYAPRVPPMPNLLAAQMEMFFRMQSGFAGLRHPLPPFPPHPSTAHSFSGFPHMNGMHPTNGSPIIQPSLHTSGSVPTQLPPNLSLLPPMTIMAPYPVPIPIPIPIPVPILFPVEKTWKTDNNTNNNNQPNISSSNDVTTTSHNGSALLSTSNASAMNASKVESVISKLVERKTKSNNNQNIVNNNYKNMNSVVDNGLDLIPRTDDNNSNGSNDNQSNGDNSEESLPQNLVVSRHKRSVGISMTTVPNPGYRIQ